MSSACTSRCPPSRARLRTGARGCCTVEDAHDARRVADILGIPFYVWDFAERFTEDVVEDFVAEYAAGRTPNPCLKCNERIKFAALLDKAVALGFDAVATGHYARLSLVDGRPELRRSADDDKDQSYVLASLREDQLRHAMFPLGGSVKSDVRAEASERGLAVADKPDSHDICFIPDGDTRAFLTRHLGERPGALVDDETGAVLGAHAGRARLHRRAAARSRPAGPGRRRPPAVRAVARTGERQRAGRQRPRSWRSARSSAPRPPGRPGSRSTDGDRVSRRSARTAAPHRPTLSIVDGRLVVRLDGELRGVAPGQAVVLYREDPDGDVVLASATIVSTR